MIDAYLRVYGTFTKVIDLCHKNNFFIVYFKGGKKIRFFFRLQLIITLSIWFLKIMNFSQGLT